MRYVYILILIILVLYIGFINYIQPSQLRKDHLVQENIKRIKYFLQEIKDYRSDYFTFSLKERLLREYNDVYIELNKKRYKKLMDENVLKFIEIYSNLQQLIKVWNEEYIESELLCNSDLLSNIDGKSLDQQQRRAVVVDEDNNLILAGAGSGKTLTISGKVKYLVDVKGIRPEEILLISFTRKAADEMNERISNKLGLSVESKTFHKLGLDIIKEKRKKIPTISDSLDNVIDKYFKETIYRDKSSFKDLLTFYTCYINIPKDIEQFENLGEYYKYCRHIDFTTIKGKYEIHKINESKEKKLKVDKKTIKGEQVKSIEEVMIANYLFINGVNYHYEEKYKYDEKDNYRKHYTPDFYLPDYDIYIEHFGVNKDNKAPWLSDIEEAKYIEEMEWKRQLHKQKGTTLVETYSYYNSEGILLEKLESKLVKLDVKFKKVDCEEIYNIIIDNEEDKYFKEFRKLISTFIGLFKSRGYTLNDFNLLLTESNKIKNSFLRQRSILFINMIKPIYIAYQESLENNLEIDFNDMIIEATEIVRNQDTKFNYKYIIIDEYQDISKSRFELIKEIKKQTNAKLMCVGDDWQSIYRFTGSDIDLFTNFEKHVGYYELLKIEKTYRNSQELIDIAGKFVMKNKKQLVKNLKSDKNNNTPIKMIYYNDDISKAVEKAIEEIVKIYGRLAEITILGRNNLDIKVLNSNPIYEVIKEGNDIFVKHRVYPNLKINYLTAHKSKGLECENVIIINLENKITGFPNQMVDDPVLDLVLTKGDGFEFAEERRLFYVALTRTKNTSYLIIPEKNSSIFCDELKKDFDIKNEVLTNEKIIESASCPKCIQGRLIKRIDMYKNEFVGCDNYPMCDFTYKSVEIFNRQVICNKCSSYMVKRKYKGNYFLGCINFPHCRNTKEYDESEAIKVDEGNTFVQNEKPKDMYINKLIEKYGEEDVINVAKEEVIRLQSKGVGASSKARELKEFIDRKESSYKWKKLYESNINYVDIRKNKEHEFKDIYEEYIKDINISDYDMNSYKLIECYPSTDEFL